MGDCDLAPYPMMDRMASKLADDMTVELYASGCEPESALSRRIAALTPIMKDALLVRGVEPPWSEKEREYANSYVGHPKAKLLKGNLDPTLPLIPFDTVVYVENHQVSVLPTSVKNVNERNFLHDVDDVLICGRYHLVASRVLE